MAATASRAGAAAQARYAALQRIVEMHQDEFTGLLGDEREARGINRIPDSGVAARRERIEKRIATLQAKLAELNGHGIRV